MIEGYAGTPGSGKTYSMTARALDEIKAGRRVFSNYAIEGAERFEPEDLLNLPPGFVVLDEAHLWMSSRSFHKLPHSWIVQLSQTRKDGWHLLWSAQHPRRVDTVLRDVTHVLWWCTAWPWSLTSEVQPRVFSAYAYDPNVAMDGNPRDPEAAWARKRRWFKKRVANAYDSWESIVGAEHLLDGDQYEDKRKPKKKAGHLHVEGL